MCSFLIYPGKALSKPEHFEQISEDINYILKNENLNINKLVFSFGGNDVEWFRLKVKNDDLKFISSHIVKGDEYHDCTNVNPSDPLNLLHGSQNNILSSVSSAFDPFFKKIEELIDFFPHAKVFFCCSWPKIY